MQKRIITFLFSLFTFHLLLAQTPFDQAVWIGATTDKNDSLADRSIVVQRDVKCKKGIVKATVTMTGLGAYELYLNGKQVGDAIMAPAWSDYNKTVFYNTLDVTNLLAKGNNTISVLLGNGFYHERGKRYAKTKTNYGPLTMLFRMDIEYKNGKKETILSDGSWRWHKSPVTYNSIYGGEDYDARIPMFTSKEQKPVVIQSAPKGVLRPQLSEPVKIMERFGVKNRHFIADKDLAAASKALKHDVPSGTFVLDMGQNLAGFPEITVSGKPGQKVTMYVSETLTPEGACNQKQSGRPHYYVYTVGAQTHPPYPLPLRGRGSKNASSSIDNTHLSPSLLTGGGSGGGSSFHPRFTYYGYRYIQVEGAVMKGDPNPLDLPVIHNVQSCFIYNSARKIGDFECSNPRINATYRIIDRAIRSNWQSVWTDCPHREKLGWLEQDWLNGEGLVYNYDCRKMIQQTMRVIADAMHDDGSLPEIAPEYITFEGDWAPPFQQSPEWGGAVVALPFLYKEHYGDDSLIKEYYPVMKRYVDYLATQDSCYILKQGLGDWYDYGPWRAGFAKNTTMPFVSTAHYYKWTLLCSHAAGICGNTADEQRLKAQATKIKEAINRDFYNAETHQYDTGSQCANAIALDMQLCPAVDNPLVLANLINDIHAHGDRLTTGDVGNRYLFKVLIDNDQHELLYQMLNHDDVPGYGYQIQKGMTTLTEQWNPDMGASMNHFMLAHINNHLIQDLAGIHINGKDVTINPKPAGDLEWAKARTETEYGTVTVEWYKQPDGSLKINYNVPEGMHLISAE